MPLNWPDAIDDTGTGTDGTPTDKALFDAIRDSIEDVVFSVANPTLTPGNTTDEVVDARGTFDTLELRLDDIQAAVGVSDPSAGSSLAASDNVLLNADLAGWKAGAAVAPDHFTLSGTGAAVARATGLGSGPFSARVTFGSAAAKLTQSIIASGDWTNQSSLGGRKISITARIKTSIASQARIVVSDGVTETMSAFHTGGGASESITVTHTISSSATNLNFYCEVAVAGSADFSGFVGTYSDLPSPSWQPAPRSGHRVLHINVTSAGTVGAAPTDLMSYLLSPGILRANAMAIHVVAMGFTGINANVKRLTLQFGSTVVELFNSSVNNKTWVFDCTIYRLTSATQVTFVHGGYGTSSVVAQSASSEDDATELEIKFVGDGTATNDIVQSYMMVEVLEPSAGL